MPVYGRKWATLLAMLACIAGSSQAGAQIGVRVVELDFAGFQRATVLLYERPNRPGEFLIPVEDIPEGILADGVLEQLPRTDEGGCRECVPVHALGGVQINERTASGLLRISPDLLSPQTITLGRRDRQMPEVQRRPGLMFNWALRGAQNDAETRNTNGAGELEMIASLGPAGVLRSDGAWFDDGGARRGSTSLEFYSVKHRFEFTLGDTISASGPLSSGRRLAGISLTRRFDAQPGRVFTPAYDLSTVSSLPGVAELYIDGERRRRQRVNAGEVTFQDIQGNYGSNVTLRFIDELGALQEVSTQLLGITRMIGRGELDYDFTGGALRRAENEYADPVAAADIRYGLTNWLNIEAFGEGVEDQYNVAIGFTLALPFAIVDITASQSRFSQDMDAPPPSQDMDDLPPSPEEAIDDITGTESGDPQDAGTPLPFPDGEAYTWSISNRAISRTSSFTYGFSGRIVDDYRRLEQESPVAEFQRAFVGTRMGRFSVSASIDRVDGVNTGSANVSTRLGRFAFSLGGTKVEGGGSAGFLSLSWVPRNAGALRQTSLGYGRSDVSESAALSANLVSARRRAAASFQVERLRSREDPSVANTIGRARIGKRWRPVSAIYNYREEPDVRYQNARLEGGIAFTGARPHAVQRIGPNDGYLVVHTGLPGTRLDYAGYNIKTDGKGRAALVTRGFSPTRFGVDLRSLPDGYGVSTDLQSTAVIPGGRGVTHVAMTTPGFLLRVRGARPGDKLLWNGEEHPIFEIGAYIEDAQAGKNRLTWKGETYIVDVPTIGSEIPEFLFDPDTGRLAPMQDRPGER